jgi:hypothetical protein
MGVSQTSEPPTKELIVKRCDSTRRYDSGMVAVRAIILGRIIGGWFPKSWQRKLLARHVSCCKITSCVGCGYAPCQVQRGGVWCNESTV